MTKVMQASPREVNIASTFQYLLSLDFLQQDIVSQTLPHRWYDP